VTHLAHRVIVMRRGRQVAEFAHEHIDAEAVVAAASGLQAAPTAGDPRTASAVALTELAA
jgi:rhamnose transport system ATP-binding protein